MQDAYALCRVFKKSATGPKIGEHYAIPTTSYQLTSDHSSSIELYSEGRCEDLESTDYRMPYDNSCSPNMVAGSSHDISGTRDGKWMQFLSEDAFNFTPPPFPNYGTVSYPPSKVKFSNIRHFNQHMLCLKLFNIFGYVLLFKALHFLGLTIL